jgi:hypothetical protein
MIESSCLISNLSTYCSMGEVAGPEQEIVPHHKLPRILPIEADPLAQRR